MKTTFPRLASLLLACWGAIAAVLAQPMPTAPDASNAQRQAASNALRAAINGLERYESIVAKVRQRTEMLGKVIVGSGNYVQGPPRYNLLRFEINLQIDDLQASVLQICDGKQLWTQRDQFGELKLTCLDAQRVLAALEKNPAARQQAAADGLALSGLPRLLRELERAFEFVAIQESKLGSLPVQVLRGQWRAERLPLLMPEQAEAIARGTPANLKRLPIQAPDEVLVYLGRDDLFPYRLEYRCNATREPTYPGDAQPAAVLLALEFYEVRVNSQIDPMHFVYTPGTARFVDETDAYLSQRGL